MIIENPAALQFFMTDEIYLSRSDIASLSTLPLVVADADEPAPVTPPASVAKPLVEQALVAPAAVIETPVLSFNYLGKNAKAFLIICHYQDTIDEKHLAALTSTLQRKELGLDDVAILNVAQYANATVRQIHSFFKPSRLLILGKQGILPGWDTLVFNQVLEKNGFKALYTDSFADMMTDRDKAKAFWEQMKQL